MKIVLIGIEEIKEYKNNARYHEEADIERLAQSISDFGFINPILVDETGTVIAGHGRLLAARKLGYEEVPVIYINDLTSEQVRAYRLADNKTGELANWDFDRLEVELGEMNDIDFTRYGFAEHFDIEPQDGLADKGLGFDEYDFDEVENIFMSFTLYLTKEELLIVDAYNEALKAAGKRIGDEFMEIIRGSGYNEEF